jgi:hypothetical protein
MMGLKGERRLKGSQKNPGKIWQVTTAVASLDSVLLLQFSLIFL